MKSQLVLATIIASLTTAAAAQEANVPGGAIVFPAETPLVAETMAPVEPMELDIDTAMTAAPEGEAQGFDLDFVVTAKVERTPAEGSPMMKKATVSTSLPGYADWVMYSDEGNPANPGGQRAPNPLSYFTAGAALCLTTQINGAEMALGLEDLTAGVEMRVHYTQDDVMTPNAVGRTESVETHVILEGGADVELLSQLYNAALTACFAGEAFKNDTPITTRLFVNGALVK